MPAFESVCHSGTPSRRFTTRGWASMLFGRSNRVKRDIGQIGLRIAADEIKNSVRAGIGAGHKRRPGHRSLGRISGFQAG